MTHLLDGNVLVALVVGDHVHHERTVQWFGPGRAFATCPITQGTLVRFLVREGTLRTDRSQAAGAVSSGGRPKVSM